MDMDWFFNETNIARLQQLTFAGITATERMALDCGDFSSAKTARGMALRPEPHLQSMAGSQPNFSLAKVLPWPQAQPR